MEVTPIKINNGHYEVGFFTVKLSMSCWAISLGGETWATAWDRTIALKKAQKFNRDMVAYNAKKANAR
jgi:hypothetical protein